MSKANNKLSDTKIKTLKTKGKYFDGHGLYLEVTSIGSKLWRLKYRFAGTEKLLSLGTYPSVTLAAARELKDEAKSQIAAGVDPSTRRIQARSATLIN